MKFSPSYDTLTSFILVSGLASVLSIREISLSNGAISNWISIYIAVAGAAILALSVYLQRKTKRRA